MSSGAELIAAERQRQVESEGWTPDHDLMHDRGEMVWAAVCYAAPETVYVVAQDGPHGRLYAEPWPQSHGYARGEPTMLPWRRSEGDRIRQLVKAGALIAAEIDRLQRSDSRYECPPGMHQFITRYCAWCGLDSFPEGAGG